jgi:hypothetical protein
MLKKYFAEKIKGSHDNLEEGFTICFYLSSTDSTEVRAFYNKFVNQCGLMDTE